MKPIEPDKLKSVREKVVREHPDKLEGVEAGEEAGDSPLARSILEKLRTYDGSNAREVARKLTEVERDYLPQLLVGYEGEDLRAALACVDTLSVTIPFEDAWYLVNQYFSEDIGRAAAENSERPSTEEAPEALRRVSETYREQSDGEALREAYQFARRQTLSSDELKSSLRVVDGSSLSHTLDEAILTCAPRELWLAQSRQYLTEVFRRFDLGNKVSALENLSRTFREASLGEVVTRDELKGIFRWVVEHEEMILSELAERAPDALDWYESVLHFLEFDDFFAEDHERYNFWKQYADRVDELHADLENGRLFLDFGTFGVVEFKQTGNATYVYRKEYFRKMLELNQRRVTNPHGSLKDKTYAIAHLSHYSGWQRKFHRRLRELLQERQSERASDDSGSDQVRSGQSTSGELSDEEESDEGDNRAVNDGSGRVRGESSGEHDEIDPDPSRVKSSDELANVGTPWSSVIENELYQKAKSGTGLLELQDLFERHIESIRKKLIALKRGRGEPFDPRLTHVFRAAAELDCGTKKWKRAEHALLEEGRARNLSLDELVAHLGRRESEIARRGLE
jgi:hypothetical protein